ncbi:Hypothetical predicted protein, partial [Paramuricea clavata]
MATDETPGSGAKSKNFFSGFVCGHLAKHVEARHLVKLKEDRFILRFNDIDRITSIYCDYIYKEKGKTLKRDFKNRRDNFLKIVGQLESDGFLKNVGSGKDYDKEFLKFEVKNSGMWHSLTKNYSVPRNPLMNLENFCASRGEPDTGLGTTQSDEPLHNE